MRLLRNREPVWSHTIRARRAVGPGDAGDGVGCVATRAGGDDDAISFQHLYVQGIPAPTLVESRLCAGKLKGKGYHKGLVSRGFYARAYVLARIHGMRDSKRTRSLYA